MYPTVVRVPSFDAVLQRTVSKHVSAIAEINIHLPEYQYFFPSFPETDPSLNLCCTCLVFVPGCLPFDILSKEYRYKGKDCKLSTYRNAYAAPR
jgi:hypothetical protein